VDGVISFEQRKIGQATVVGLQPTSRHGSKRTESKGPSSRI
jgi:hypothetical protein